MSSDGDTRPTDRELLTGRDLYVAEGWSGCAGSTWENLPPATREGWDYAARTLAARAPAPPDAAQALVVTRWAHARWFDPHPPMVADVWFRADEGNGAHALMARCVTCDEVLLPATFARADRLAAEPDAATRTVQVEQEALAKAWDDGAQAATDWIKSGAWLATMPDNPFRAAADPGTRGEGA